jgi:hypothetical protein
MAAPLGARFGRRLALLRDDAAAIVAALQQNRHVLVAIRPDAGCKTR